MTTLRTTTAQELLALALRKLIEPTERQREVLKAIHVARCRNGFPPTIRELGSLLRISSTNAVACHLAALQRKGFITSSPRKGRTLALTNSGRDWLPREAA